MAWWESVARGNEDGFWWIRNPNLSPSDGVAWALDRSLWLGSGGAVIELGLVPATDALEVFGESVVDTTAAVAGAAGETLGAAVGGAASGAASKLSLGGLALLGAAVAGAVYVLRR